MNNDIFLIENSDLDLVKELCACISEADKRNSAVANMLAAEIAKKYFTEIDVDSVTSLHEIPQVLEDIEISDIYIKNNYIDVRLYFENEPIFVPESHFNYNIAPLAYMFIKVNEELSSATVTGFVLASSIDSSKAQNGYITISEEDLISYYDLENNLAYNEIEDTNDEFDIEIFNYLDNKLENKPEFYNALLKSPDARTKLKNAAKAKLIFNFVSITKENNNTTSGENTSLETSSEAEVLDIDSQEVTLAVQEDTFLVDSDVEDSITLDFSDENQLEEFDSNIDLESSSEDENAEIITLDMNDSSDDLISNNDEITLEQADDIVALGPDTIYDENQQDNDSIDLFAENTEEEQISVVEDNIEEVDLAIEQDIIEDFSIEGNSNDKEETFEIVEDNTIEDSVEIIEDNSDNADIQQNNDVEIDVQNVPEELNNIVENIDSNVENYSTNTTPSLNSLENAIEEAVDEDDLMKSLEEEVGVERENIIPEQEKAPENEPLPASPEIDALFNEKLGSNSGNKTYKTQQRKGNPLTFIGIVALLGALGYFGYTKYFATGQINNIIPTKAKNTAAVKTEKEVIAPKPVPMPNETVENVKTTQQTEEAVSETIPAIENNLDTSVLVSNLSVKWEVPAGYISSGTAKRYFTKLGKILQLNLKTELLLLSKPPLTNKICVELTFNKANQKFEVKDITVSSGEKNIDEIIKSTVNNALNINLNMNMSVFENIPGNPVLEINL